MRRLFFNLFLTIALLTVGLQLFFSLHHLHYFENMPYDFRGYYYAAKSTLAGGDPYHNPAAPEAFQYPPNALLVFSFLGFFSSSTAFLFWTSLSLVALLMSLFLLVKILGLKLNYQSWCLFLIAVFLAFPVRYNFSTGQINSFLLLAFVTSWWAFLKRKGFLSGAVLALVGGIKVFPLFVVSYFLFKRAFLVVLSTILSFILLFFSSGLLFGRKVISGFGLPLGKMSVEAMFTNKVYYNQALSGFLSRLGLETNTSFFLYIIISILLLVPAVKVVAGSTKKTPLSLSLEYSLFIVLWLLLGYFSWQHYFIVLIFPFLALWRFFQKMADKKMLFFTFLSYLMVAFNIKQAILPANMLSVVVFSHVFYGTLLLYFLLLLSLKRLKA